MAKKKLKPFTSSGDYESVGTAYWNHDHEVYISFDLSTDLFVDALQKAKGALLAYLETWMIYGECEDQKPLGIYSDEFEDPLQTPLSFDEKDEPTYGLVPVDEDVVIEAKAILESHILQRL